MNPITLTSQQIRILRFSAFSLGSILIFYCLVQFASNDNVPSSSPHLPSTRPSSSHPSSGPSRKGSSLGLNGEPIGNDELLWRESTGERRLSMNHAWIKPRQHRRVLVGSHFTAHEDVYMSFVHTLGKIIPPQNVRVYAETFRWGFDDVVQRIGLYRNQYFPPDRFVKDVNNDQLFGKGFDGGKMADLVVLGTCEIDLAHFGPDLFKQYQARPDNDKFTLVCIVHNAFEMDWALEHGKDWVREGALRVLPISAHVKRAFLYQFDTWSDMRPHHQVGFEYIPVHSHIPVLPLQLDPKPTKHAMLTDAVIQGSFDPNRRDYESVFEELLTELKADPLPWGYHPLTSTSPSSTSYTPNPTPDRPPFVLHLAGDGEMRVPELLKHIVQVHKGLSYPDFFELMNGMDVAMLAFSESKKGGYFEVQASSSVAMAMMCKIPLLATHHIQKVYTYTLPSSVSITRPSYLSEIQAIKVLRAGTFTPLPDERPPPGVEEEVKEMLRRGWKRDMRSWEEWTEMLDEGNKRVGELILSGF